MSGGGLGPVRSGFPEIEEARSLLRGLLPDHLNIDQMRRFLSREGTAIDVSRLSNHQVLEFMAQRVRTGAMVLKDVPLSRAGVGQAPPPEPYEEDTAPPPRYIPPENVDLKPVHKLLIEVEEPSIYETELEVEEPPAYAAFLEIEEPPPLEQG